MDEIIIAIIRKSFAKNRMPYHCVINNATNGVAQNAFKISKLTRTVKTAKNKFTSQNDRKNFDTTWFLFRETIAITKIHIEI